MIIQARPNGNRLFSAGLMEGGFSKGKMILQNRGFVPGSEQGNFLYR